MSTFPTLLGAKATMLGGLTRVDLCVAGGGYMVLSMFTTSGIFSILVIVGMLSGLRYIRRLLPPGFFAHLGDPVLARWSDSMREVKR